MLVIAATLALALVLSAYVVRAITADDRLPSQEFLASFSTPIQVAQNLSQSWKDLDWDEVDYLSAKALAAVQEIQAGRVPLSRLIEVRDALDLDYAQVAEDSLTHARIHVPTPAEFEAAEATNTPLYDRLMAAMTLDEADLFGPIDLPKMLAAKVEPTQPAKRVRVYTLAEDCGVSSKFLRTVLSEGFGIATKSPSSTVSHEQAVEVVEFFHTHGVEA